jgi:hypothetical protein
MKILTLLKQKVYALEMSERCSPKQAKKLRHHLKGLKHSLSIKDSKQTRIHIEFILEILAELIKA